MAAAGEWELVVRGGKKGKTATVANGKLNKEEKRQFIKNAPRMTETGGIEIGSSGKENRKPKSPKATTSSNAPAPKKKKADKKGGNDGPSQPGTLEEAVRRLSVSQMQNLLDVVKSRFHDTPLIWLKDLASYLNVRVNPINAPDPAFRGHPPGFPVSLMSSDVKKLLLSTVGGCSDSVLAAFHKHCITAMVQEQVKGLGVAGYKLFIQILALHKPEIGVVNLPYYCDLRQNLQSQTPACLSLLWAVGQSGIDDFNVGLRVWLELMMPVIGLKNYSGYVVEYGGMVFGRGVGDGDGECSDVLGVRQFFSIFDFTWVSSTSLPKHIQRQLYALYPKVKTMAFSSNPEVTLRNFFPSFLRRLDSDVSNSLKTELLTCLVQCLTQDPQCWCIWSQLYLKHLPQSATLLQHLGEEWKVLGQSLRMQVREAREAVEGFERNNQKLAHKVHSVVGVREATEATQKQDENQNGKSRERLFSLPVIKTAQKDGRQQIPEPPEVEPRFSYMRASNSYRRYGKTSRNKDKNMASGDEFSEYSSREDLLDPQDCPSRPSNRRRKLYTTKNKYSMNSSSDDLLNEDSDMTDGIFSMGIPETDGSVFSSQEDILEPRRRCSDNVYHFMRRSSSGIGYSGNSSRQDIDFVNLPQVSGSSISFSRNSSRQGVNYDHLPHISGSNIGYSRNSSREDVTYPQISGSSIGYSRNSSRQDSNFDHLPDISGSNTWYSRNSSRQDLNFDHLPQISVENDLPAEAKDSTSHHSESKDQSEAWSKFFTYENEGRSNSPSSIIYVAVGAPSPSPGPVRSQTRSSTGSPDRLVTLQQRIQNAMMNTIHRLVSHIGRVKEEVKVVEGKCLHLKDTMCALEYEQFLLDQKLSKMELEFKCTCNEKGASFSSTGASFSSTGTSSSKTNDAKSFQECTGHVLFEKSNVRSNAGRVDVSTCTSLNDELLGTSNFCSLSLVSDEAVLLSYMRKTAKAKSKSPRFIKLAGILIVAAIIWDVKNAGSFAGSKVGQTLERLGVVPYLEAFGSASKRAIIIVYRWFALNLPIWYSRGCELAGPYLILLVEKAGIVWGYCWGSLETAAAYLPVAKQKFETSLPGVSAAATNYGTLAWSWLQSSYISVRDISAPYLSQAHQYLLTNVFVGPLAPEKIQEHLVGAFDYVSQTLIKLHTGLVGALNDTKTR